MSSANKQMLYILFLSLISPLSLAGQLSVAVAGNFYKPLKVISAHYQEQTGHQILLSVGATGKLYAQISNGAPFEILLAADRARPSKLVEQKLAVQGSQFTYGKGKLLLWSSDPALIDAAGEILKSPQIVHLAIANPKTAPYGAAAIEVLKNLGIYQQLKGKIVEGQSVGQSFQQISSGAVELGIIALSQVLVDHKIASGSGWIIPTTLYQPIQQDAVLLNEGKTNPIAKDFLRYLQTPECKEIIRSFGYQVDA
ncbi:MAG: molybdate transport system substrate-binding protein [Psychromonas sp.]|jgi:molybdate transport system substrate-binding protein|uniref:molybdate ABC transporter substrate-binding protein n=1 Tax=Psychromonas sp. TaxID=1884585 RepID=UPI0039E52962